MKSGVEDRATIKSGGLDLLGKVKQKPYFNAPNFVLYKEDCFKILEQLPANSVDMVFADPPYNLSNGGFTVHAGKRVSVNKGHWDKSNGFQDDLEFHEAWIKAAKRILKPEGTLWVSGTYHSIYQCGYAIQKQGFKILNDVAWYKPNASPNLSGRYFTASHETLIWAKKDPKAKHIYNYPEIKHGWWHKIDPLKRENKQMRSVWAIDFEKMPEVWAITTPKAEEKKFGKHPTQKPLDLLRLIIESSTKSDALIVDPFTGSSTTGVAAVESGRKFIGIDTEKEYLDLSIKRFEDVKPRLL